MGLSLEKYDKVVWRINGTLLVFVFSGIFLLIAAAGYKLVGELFGQKYVSDAVKVDKSKVKEERLYLGAFEPLKGTSLIFMPLHSEQKFEGSYSFSSKKSYDVARNYLILNSQTKDTYWIWKQNTLLVFDEIKIYNQIRDEQRQQTKGFVFEIVERDSNSDGMLNGNDQRSIQYFDLITKKMNVIVVGIDKIIGIRQVSDDEILFLYSRSQKSYFKSLTLSTALSTDEQEIRLPL